VEQFELYFCELAKGASPSAAAVGALDPGDHRQS
jgi:hypothetical protein